MSGLSKEIVVALSERKNDPEWMRDLRLRGLELWDKLEMPKWAPKVFAETEEERRSGEWIDIDKIDMYVEPRQAVVGDWEEVPKEVRAAFEDLGIPEAERESLAGLGAQYDTDMTYLKLKKEIERQGVVFLPMDEAVQDPEYGEMVRERFMKLVSPEDNKFMALHAAVHSGGVFIYVPKDVDVTLPLQAYYRFNAPGAGQFEHSIIVVDEGARVHFIEGCSAPKYAVANLHAGCVEVFVEKNARLKFSAVVNWSKNLFNLTTKRIQVEEGGRVEWVSGVFGSKTSMLYPMTLLKGWGASVEYMGLSLAGEGQELDVGAKVVHQAPETCSVVRAKSLVMGGGVAKSRLLAVVTSEAKGAKSYMDCKALILDEGSKAEAVPEIKVATQEAEVSHEASVGKISDEAILYLQSRGLTETDARALIVRGFAKEVTKEVPWEYASEMNDLLRLEMGKL